MIHAFIGTNTQKAHNAMNAAIKETCAMHPDVLVTRFDDTSFDPLLATEALAAQNLFGSGNIIVFDGILDHLSGEVFYETMLQKTTNTVFLRETELKKELLAELKKIATIEEYDLLKKTKKPENSFAIADAIGARDKKTAWVEFEKACRLGLAMEEIHGTIFWAFKSMYIAATVSKEEAIATGMKEYTYRTYLNFAKHYLHSELKDKLGELKDMYHRAHRGEGDLEIQLEQFFLKL